MSATILSGPRIGSTRRARVLDDEATPRWLIPIATLVTVAPIVVATVRALANGWLAIGDNANFLIRSRDVLTEHHPLLGTWSSASNALGEPVNHPGPLMFDLFAIPAKLGGSGGLAVGVALVGIACVIGIAVFAARAGGAQLALTSLAASAGLAWTMGPSLLYDPWNPHVVLLPFLFLLVLVLGMALGDVRALPFAVVVASLVVQTHLTYALLVPALGVVGVVLLVRRRGHEVLRPALLALVVLVLAWAQPLIDQVTGDGNIGTLAGGFGASEDSVGAELGARVVAEVLSTPPWWARPSFEGALRVPTAQPTHVGGEPNVAGLPSPVVTVMSLAALGAVLVGTWVMTHRRDDDVASAALFVSVAAVTLALLAAVTQPLSNLGLTSHQIRYLWPIGTFASAALLLALTRRRFSFVGPLLAIVVLSVLNVPAHAATVGPANDVDVVPVMRELASQLDDLDVDEPILYDTAGIRLAEPWTSAVLAALAERSIEFRVEEETWVRQLGEGRRADGEATWRMYLREGADAEETPEGARRVAFVDGLDMDERDELERLKRQLVDVDVRLTDRGQAANALDPLPHLRDEAPDVAGMVREGWLSVYVLGGLVDVPASDRADVLRYADLWYRWNRYTIALFVEPVDGVTTASLAVPG